MLRFIGALVLLTALLLFLLPHSTEKSKEEGIIQLALADAKAKFPNAQIEVLEVNHSGDNYLIKLKVSEGWDTKCPKRYHITYIYPERHFIGEKELMNPSCEPCQCPNPPCVILFEEEAVAATAPYGEGTAHRVWKEGNLWKVEWDNGVVAISENCSLEAGNSGE